MEQIILGRNFQSQISMTCQYQKDLYLQKTRTLNVFGTKHLKYSQDAIKIFNSAGFMKKYFDFLCLASVNSYLITGIEDIKVSDFVIDKCEVVVAHFPAWIFCNKSFRHEPNTHSLKFLLLLIPLKFRKAGRVWCGGARVTCHNIVTSSKIKEFLKYPCF